MCEKCVAVSELPLAGSRRRRLWDLPAKCHCPVMGVCIPISPLRKLMSKVMKGVDSASDYEIHLGAVNECLRRNPLSELLQKELENRYSLKIQLFKLARSTDHLASLWMEAVNQGDVSGAFWATLTHPRCDEGLQEMVLQDMHMIQHHAGAAVTVDIKKFNSLSQDYLTLEREHAKSQERHARAISDKVQEIEQLHSRIDELRAVNVATNIRLESITNEFLELKSSIQEFESFNHLLRKIENLELRQLELDANNAKLKKDLQVAEKTINSYSVSANDQVNAVTAIAQAVDTYPIEFYLKGKAVLCVGGRSGNVANYREVVERVGANFLHHDGGLEDNYSILDANLSAADLVICQTGCISHNSYWKVKDFCKRTGKRCVFVENPGVSSLARGLQKVINEESEGLTTQNIF
jgi:hypothetical protein